MSAITMRSGRDLDESFVPQTSSNQERQNTIERPQVADL